MNRLTPYAALFMRLAVGGVFLHHGLVKWHNGIPALAGFFLSIGIPLANLAALAVILVETVGAACVLLGIFTRVWAACMAVEMLVAIVRVQLPRGTSFELEALLFAGALTLVALGDGPLSIAIGLRRRPQS
ncbi:MAG TPA: DoxX family protein [Gemmatimonadales bacterium]|nr:DoxX family protein [Gemmatimonadales bacterium]